jgi:hypothetical protein
VPLAQSSAVSVTLSVASMNNQRTIIDVTDQQRPRAVTSLAAVLNSCCGHPLASKPDACPRPAAQDILAWAAWKVTAADDAAPYVAPRAHSISMVPSAGVGWLMCRVGWAGLAGTSRSRASCRRRRSSSCSSRWCSRRPSRLYGEPYHHVLHTIIGVLRA